MAKKQKAADGKVMALRLEEMPIEQLIPADYNPRVKLQPGDEEYEKLSASIERFGQVEPLVWNQRSGNLVGGHQRLEVLKAKGYTHVPVSVVDLSPTEERALSLALNKIAGRWDDVKLHDVLSDLHQTMDLLSTGFTANDLAELTASLSGPVPTLQDDTDGAFEPSLEPKVTRSDVTAKDVQQAEQAQSDRFVSGREPKDVTCPNCAFVFGVGGWLKEYIEDTEKLQAEANK